LPVFPDRPACNPHHYTWFDKSRHRRTCQEYAVGKYCTTAGDTGSRWKDRWGSLDRTRYINNGYSALNCPQCGCELNSPEDLVVPPISGTCDQFTMWHKINIFKMKNYYTGTYYIMPNVRYNDHAVYKQKGRIVYAISVGNAWVLTNFFKYSNFQFKLEGQETDCPAREIISDQKTWEHWKRHDYRKLQDTKSSMLYYQLSQWAKVPEASQMGTVLNHEKRIFLST